MSRALATRLKKIEAKRHVRRAIQPIIFTSYPDEGDGDIVALAHFGHRVERLFGESDLAAFARRAAAILCRPGLPAVMFGHRAELEPSPAPDAAPVTLIDEPAAITAF